MVPEQMRGGSTGAAGDPIVRRVTKHHRPEAYGQRRQVGEDVEMEHAQEEGAEVIKHLEEVVPVHADVRREVR